MCGELKNINKFLYFYFFLYIELNGTMVDQKNRMRLDMNLKQQVKM